MMVYLYVEHKIQEREIIYSIVSNFCYSIVKCKFAITLVTCYACRWCWDKSSAECRYILAWFTSVCFWVFVLCQETCLHIFSFSVHCIPLSKSAKKFIIISCLKMFYYKYSKKYNLILANYFTNHKQTEWCIHGFSFFFMIWLNIWDGIIWYSVPTFWHWFCYYL